MSFDISLRNPGSGFDISLSSASPQAVVTNYLSAGSVFEPAVAVGAVTAVAQFGSFSPTVNNPAVQEISEIVEISVVEFQIIYTFTSFQIIFADTFTQPLQVYQPSATAGSAVISAEKTTIVATVNEPSVAAGAATVEALYLSVGTRYEPQVSVAGTANYMTVPPLVFTPSASSAYTVQHQTLSFTASLYEPSLVYLVDADVFIISAQINNPTLAAGAVNVETLLLVVGLTGFEPSVAVGATLVEAEKTTIGALLYEPALVVGQTTVSTTFLSAGFIFEPAVQTTTTVAALAGSFPISLFEPSVLVGGVTVNVDKVALTGSAFEPVAAPGPVTVAADYHLLVAAVFTPQAAVGAVTVEAQVLEVGTVFEPALEHLIDAQYVDIQIQVNDPAVAVGTAFVEALLLDAPLAGFEPYAGTAALVSVVFLQVGATFEPSVATSGVVATTEYAQIVPNTHDPAIQVGAAFVNPDFAFIGITVRDPGIYSVRAATHQTLEVTPVGYWPSVVAGEIQVTAQFLQISPNFFEAAVSTGGAFIGAELVVQQPNFFEPSIAAGATSVVSDYLDISDTIFEPAAATSNAVAVDKVLIAPDVRLPVLFEDSALIPDYALLGEAVFTPSLLAGAVSIAPDFVGVTAQVFPPEAIQVLVPAYLDASPTIESPAVQVGAVQVGVPLLSVSPVVYEPRAGASILVVQALWQAQVNFFSPTTIAHVEANTVTISATVYDPATNSESFLVLPSVAAPLAVHEPSTVTAFVDLPGGLGAITVFQPRLETGAIAVEAPEITVSVVVYDPTVFMVSVAQVRVALTLAVQEILQTLAVQTISLEPSQKVVSLNVGAVSVTQTTGSVDRSIGETETVEAIDLV